VFLQKNNDNADSTLDFDNVNMERAKPSSLATMSGDQTLGLKGTWTKVDFDTELNDDGAVYDTVNQRYYARRNGVYIFAANVGVEHTSDAESSAMRFQLNGATNFAMSIRTSAKANDVVVHNGVMTARLAAGDYMEVDVSHIDEDNATVSAG
jgi:hypothetical protein